MKDPIHDLHFIPFGLAMAIYQKGYNEESLFVYRYNTEDLSNVELICLGSPKKSIKLKKYSTVPALTYDEAAEWIRNTYHCHIAIYPSMNLGYYATPNNNGYFNTWWIGEIFQLIETPWNARMNSFNNCQDVVDRSGKRIWFREVNTKFTYQYSTDYYSTYNDCIKIILDNC